jgi:hypothetical protein
LPEEEGMMQANRLDRPRVLFPAQVLAERFQGCGCDLTVRQTVLKEGAAI